MYQYIVKMIDGLFILTIARGFRMLILGSIFVLLASALLCAAELSVVVNLDVKSDSDRRNLGSLVKKNIKVIGTAENMKMGAALWGKYGVIVVNSLERWPGGLRQKKVIVTGTLTTKMYKFHPPNIVPPALPEGRWYFISHGSSRVYKEK